ncbi:uncharacterized protein LOC120344116 [Styela clava]|uniref:carboxypeptidase N subunit 2-like n=1 Tax=Styela clava TaxID=7725 RepID=UPI00193A91A1|nr:carboxypeptidase N subunit 2-like [Styela clava]
MSTMSSNSAIFLLFLCGIQYATCFVTLRMGGSMAQPPQPQPELSPHGSVSNHQNGGISSSDDEYFHPRQLHPITQSQILTCPRVDDVIRTNTEGKCPRGWVNEPACDTPDHRNIGSCKWKKDTEFEMPLRLATFRGLLCKSKRMKCLKQIGIIPGDTELLHLPRNSFSDKAELAETMAHLKDVVAVNFARNNYLLLSPKTFQKNVCLRSVNFDMNFLLDIPESLFFTNKQLTSVSFVGNKLDFLPPRLFFWNPRLIIVNFERNNITLLPKEVFRRNRRLEVVRFTGNSLPDIPQGLFSMNPFLREVGLSHNRISVVPKMLFRNTRNLRELSLSGNKLRNLPADLFDNCRELRTLTLDRNLITNLPSRLFDRNPKLSHVDISYNQLHIINPNLFVNNPIVAVVNKKWGTKKGHFEEEYKKPSTPRTIDKISGTHFYRKNVALW